MRAVYGSFQHDDNEVYVISWDKQAIRTPRGFVRSVKITAQLGGTIIGTPAQISAAMDAREVAYSVHGYDFNILDANGGLTAFQLPVTGSYGGTVVEKPITFSNVDNAQYATKLNYSFTLSAEYPWYEGIAGSDVVIYQESITGSGGLPILVLRPCVNSTPVEQVTSPQAPCFTTQTGILVTTYPNPAPNPPIWPQYLQNSSSVTYTTPDILRGEFLQQGVQWNYQYASSVPLI